MLASELHLLECLPDGTAVLDGDFLVVAVNAAFLELTGQAREQVLGRGLDAIIADEDLVHMIGLRAAFQPGLVRDMTVLFRGSDGQPRPLVVSATYRPAEGGVLTARSAAVLQQELADTSRWAAEEQDRAEELTRIRDDLEAKNSALRAAQAEVESAYARLQSEVQAREKLESELRLAHKLEAIGQLSAGLAHEINTPMQYVGDSLAFLESAVALLTAYVSDVKTGCTRAATLAELQRSCQEAGERADLEYMLAEAPKALASSQAGIHRVSDIVRAMKSFARLDHGRKIPCDVNQALLDTLIVSRSQYKDVAKVETDLADIPEVMGFPGGLNQAFLQLIVNAAQAISANGRAELGVIRVSSRFVGGAVEVSIADNGCGIPPALRHRIFDPFFTTREVGRGSGQGLSTVRSVIVDGHGGSISFESEVGVGSMFTVRLPADG